MNTPELVTLIRSALAGGDLPEDLPEGAEAVASIVLAARDLVTARRERDGATAAGDMRSAKAWGAELCVAEDQAELHLRTLGSAMPRPRPAPPEPAGQVVVRDVAPPPRRDPHREKLRADIGELIAGRNPYPG